MKSSQKKNGMTNIHIKIVIIAAALVTSLFLSGCNICFGLGCNQVTVVGDNNGSIHQEINNTSSGNDYVEIPTTPSNYSPCDVPVDHICGEWAQSPLYPDREYWKATVHGPSDFEGRRLSEYWVYRDDGTLVYIDVIFIIKGWWTMFDVNGDVYSAFTCDKVHSETDNKLDNKGMTQWQTQCVKTYYSRDRE